MRLEQIMSSPAITCPAGATMEQAAQLMWDHDLGIVPIVDDDGRLTGVLTDRDICMAAYTQGKALASIPVTTGMARQVVASHLDDDAAAVEGLLRDNQIRRLPVIDDDGRPIGIVSINDLARLTARVRKNGLDRDFVQTMAAICEPRVQAVDESPAVEAPAALAMTH